MSYIHFIGVTGDKGGVGKSRVALLLADYLESKGHSTLAADTDNTNPTFLRFMGEETEQVDTLDPNSLDAFLETCRTQPLGKQIVVDFGAGRMERFLDWVDAVGLDGFKDEIQMRLTFLFVLGSDKDSLQILRDLFDRCQGLARFVIVKNFGRSKEFQLYDGSQTRRDILKRPENCEISVSALLERTMATLDKLNLRFSQAVAGAHPGLTFVDQQRTKRFLAENFRELDRGFARP